MDAEVTEKFGKMVEQAGEGLFDDWKDSPEGLVALLILMDQFSRHIWRGKGGSYQFDNKALQLVEEALEKGVEKKLRSLEARILGLVLEHAENLDVQERCITYFKDLQARSAESLISLYDMQLKAAREHYETIKQFGRFPHRNAVLGRENTPEEVAYLAREDLPGWAR